MDAIGSKLLGFSLSSCSVHASDHGTWHIREIGKIFILCVSVCYHANSLLHISFIHLKCCFVDLVLLLAYQSITTRSLPIYFNKAEGFALSVLHWDGKVGDMMLLGWEKYMYNAEVSKTWGGNLRSPTPCMKHWIQSPEQLYRLPKYACIY